MRTLSTDVPFSGIPLYPFNHPAGQFNCEVLGGVRTFVDVHVFRHYVSFDEIDPNFFMVSKFVQEEYKLPVPIVCHNQKPTFPTW